MELSANQKRTLEARRASIASKKRAAAQRRAPEYIEALEMLGYTVTPPEDQPRK